MAPQDLHVLVLAAGASRRLGQPKQLVKLGEHTALQRVVANAIAAVGPQVSVVLGAHAAAITRALAHSPATVLINRQWEEGIASSIRCGIRALPGSCEAVLLLLGDQVAITKSDLARLCSAQSHGDQIVACRHGEHLGVPAIFPRWCFTELLELRGDVGARQILRRHVERVTSLAMPNAAVDLDTPADLEALNAAQNSETP
jgi:molybdenum cofactor cytidylyltransferase